MAKSPTKKDLEARVDALEKLTRMYQNEYARRMNEVSNSLNARLVECFGLYNNRDDRPIYSVLISTDVTDPCFCLSKISTNVLMANIGQYHGKTYDNLTDMLTEVDDLIAKKEDVTPHKSQTTLIDLVLMDDQ